MAKEERSVTLKLYRGSTPRLLINYKDKNDLYEKFTKKLKRFNLRDCELYSYDCDGDSITIKNADDLLVAVENTYNPKVFIRPKVDEPCLPSSPAAISDEKKCKGNSTKTNTRGRSPSPANYRGRSRSEPRYRSPPEFDHAYYPICTYGPWMDPRYQSISFAFQSPAYGMNYRSSHHRRSREY